MCIFRETCGDALALEHNGDLYSCDHFVEPEHLLGNIIETTTMVELVASPKQRAFGQAKADTLPTSTAGSARCASPATASVRRTASPSPPTVRPGLNYLCAGYRRFFNHIDGPMKLMADLLRQGRYADEIVGVFRAAGRNDPCPCGSGRKAKNCHAA